MSRKSRTRKAISYFFLTMVTAFYTLPFIWMLRSSLMPMYQIFINPPVLIPNPVQWSNYSDVSSFVPFGRYYLNTFIITVMTVIGTVVTSTMSAYAFSRVEWPYRDQIFSIMLSSMMLPFVVTLIPTFIGWKVLGAIDSYIPLVVPAWFGGGMYNVFLLRQFFRGIPREYDEAAFVDGANHWFTFSRIILPLSKPAVVTVALLSFLRCWNDFLGPLVYINTELKYTVALGLQQFVGTYSAQWHLMMAASTMAIIPVIVLFFIGQNYLIEGVSLTGVKG